MVTDCTEEDGEEEEGGGKRRRLGKSVTAIDFGLCNLGVGGGGGGGGGKGKTPPAEDFAVDLYVLERSVVSTHEDAEELKEEIQRVYKNECRLGDKVVHKLGEVRMRGRKRECFG
ncbi:hypothetical protein TrCOL_g7136 [Triparma columacea]|uniref:non-specific serine/threonine protein kinase n=1 Tax=Triparma columacea TaxID=722753 RepID=A0A9W7L297_9STRA|nr:hypothetical protein TrCOL_g7136 [Triparma columacea]